MMGPLLKLLNEYDTDRETCIMTLQKELDIANEKIARLTTLLMSATQANERKTLELILAGHFDNLTAQSQEVKP